MLVIFGLGFYSPTSFSNLFLSIRIITYINVLSF